MSINLTSIYTIWDWSYDHGGGASICRHGRFYLCTLFTQPFMTNLQALNFQTFNVQTSDFQTFNFKSICWRCRLWFMHSLCPNIHDQCQMRYLWTQAPSTKNSQRLKPHQRTDQLALQIIISFTSHYSRLNNNLRFLRWLIKSHRLSICTTSMSSDSKSR